MSKITLDSALAAALVAGFTNSVKREAADQAGLTADEAQIGSLSDQLATTNHTLADVQAKCADLQNNLPADAPQSLIDQINALLGTPDTTGAGTSPIVTPAPDAKPPQVDAGAGVGTSGSPITGNTNTGGTAGTNGDNAGAPTAP